jgi:hypothetical protein
MHTPETSRLFTRWRNPASGVDSFILTERLAPVQQSFYFTNPAMTADGRFLWLRCAYPPPGGKHAAPVSGVVDFQSDTFHVYHETQFSASSPLVDPASGAIYWTNHLDIFKRGPLPDDKAVRISRFPAEIARGRTPERLASHLFFSADRKSLVVDARFDNETHVGEIPLDGSPIRIWQQLEGFYDHAQFSPTDPDVILFAHEFWKDHEREPFDGLRPYHRLWLIRRGQRAEPVLRRPVSHSGHEWWDPGGRHIYYVHYGVGVKKVDLETREETNLWPGHLAHSHSDQSGRYLVADRMGDPKVCDCIVEFFDTQTGKKIEIVNRPPLADHLTQCTHLHPHPQFVASDRYICHTTTIHDRVDVALVPVAPLRSRP